MRARRKPPAFQFYPADFLIGTLHLTNAQTGIYIRLLCWSWDEGPLPNDPVILARRVGEEPATFAREWETLAAKFCVTKRGLINPRLERVRQEQLEFARKQQQNGRLGGRPKKNPPVMFGLTQNEPKHNLSISNSISISNSEDQDQEHTPRARANAAWNGNPHHNPTNLINGAELRRHGTHAWCSDRICVPRPLHEDFKRQALKTDDDLRAFYRRTVDALDGQPFGDDAFTFWRNAFAGWIAPVSRRPATRALTPLQQLAAKGTA